MVRECIVAGTIGARDRAMLSIDTTVAELVLDHSECATVFDRYRIDYCCKGNRSLRDACGERSVDPGKVLDECELAVRRREIPDIDPRTLSTQELITNVIGQHHRYLHRTLPFLQTLSQRVSRVHGDRQVGLREVATRVDTLATILLAHLDDEERNLFPALLSEELEIARPLLATMREEL
jgi:regulator of cell morphogenesis and NO signaling